LPLGGIEAHADVSLGALERKPDITPADLRDELAGRGMGVSAALCRFLQPRRIALGRPGMRPSGIVPIS